MHVLLVEDSPINRRFIGLALSKVGIQVTHAENGLVAVEKAPAGGHDAILMDMQMPIMDGFQATTRLRHLGLTIPIIALTGHSTQEDRERCLRVGCTDHLTKPVDSNVLLEALKRAVCTSPPGIGYESEEFCDELREIARDYLDIQRQRLHEMNELHGNGDFVSLAELAHRVKGTAGTVGFPQFTGPAESLEQAARCANVHACVVILEEMASLQIEAEALA